jgi:3-methyladenine DNA glycosylase/8-oxoguanine DNA glycosylase
MNVEPWPEAEPRRVAVPTPFSLGRTCGPVAWGGGRWPNIDWLHGTLLWVGREDGRVAWRRVAAREDGCLDVAGNANPAGDAAWTNAVLGAHRSCPPLADPVVECLRQRHRGLRPFADGSLYEGLVTSIVGQSISVAAAAVTIRKLAALFHPGLELAGRRFWPLPDAEQLAAADPGLIRQSGVTWRRAAALVEVGRAAATGTLPDAVTAHADPDTTRALLRRLPLVGPWTVESALLWGIGLDDAHPTGDTALLRAVRVVYGEPALDFRELDRRAETWRPARGWAARLLWTDLLGVAPG